MKKIIISLITLLTIMVVIAGCSSGNDTNAPTETQSTASASASRMNSDTEGHEEYTRVEQCFECHISYAEHAETTAYLGDWNPHDSIHGGYLDCMNCHSFQKLERNYCAYCHEYKPDTEK